MRIARPEGAMLDRAAKLIMEELSYDCRVLYDIQFRLQSHIATRVGTLFPLRQACRIDLKSALPLCRSRSVLLPDDMLWSSPAVVGVSH